MTVSGAAEKLADRLVATVGDAGPHTLLIGMAVPTAALGQLISNTATTLVVIPIAVSAAAELDVSVRPVLMSLNVVASAALRTPVATPQHDGDGSRRVPVHRQRQTRRATARLVLRRRHRHRAPGVEFLTCRPTNRPTVVSCRPASSRRRTAAG